MTAIRIEGYAPIKMEFTDGSSGEVPLNEREFALAMEHAPAITTGSDEDEAKVDFMTVEWPDTLQVFEDDEELSLEEVHARFTQFLMRAIRAALNKIQEQVDNTSDPEL